MSFAQAQIDWTTGQPRSRQYQDVYFSSDSGMDETRHVFLTNNYLQQRWLALTKNHFIIGETGFGTGLNFLCAWQLWNQCAPPNARLHFVSIEKHPLTLEDLTQALNLWPQLADQRDQLLKQYKWLTPGFHRLSFDNDRVNLTLLVGDASQMLPKLQHSYMKTTMDAWFLDGFSPARNPEMWQQSIFKNMASLSHGETTFSTFTSAGEVRRGLEAAGFKVQKVAGFGRKREMLCGQYGASTVLLEDTIDPRAIVIGGGIAGTASSHALARRGWRVQLIERHNGLAQEASGNPVGILYPRLNARNIMPGTLALSGFLHTSRLLRQIDPDNRIHEACGLVQLAFNAHESKRLQAIIQTGELTGDMVCYVDKHQAGDLTGIGLENDALYFPTAGWVKPPAFCELLASHEMIEVTPATHALKIIRSGELWQVWNDRHMLAEAPVVIIANANDAKDFEQSSHLALQPVRGQISMVKSTAASRQLKTILCTDGYLSPEIDGHQCFGATFSPDDTSTVTRTEDHQANLEMLRRMAPQLHHDLASQAISGRAALRCATPDYLPATGALLDSAAITTSPPKHNADPASLPWLQGLYVNIGHGSKGLISAPLCAEILAGVICGEPLPVDNALFTALDPNRFLLKKLGLKRLLMSKRADTITPPLRPSGKIPPVTEDL